MTAGNTKQDILNLLRQEQERWETLFSGWTEEEITAPVLPGGWSVKDVMAHLMTWQQRTRSRLSAALQNKAPEFPGWPAGLEPEAEENVQQLNAWIYETNRDRPWAAVYRDWRDGFNQVLAQGEAVPEQDLLQPGRYPWLENYSLADILLASYEHHHEEHYKPLRAWLEQSEKRG